MKLNIFEQYRPFSHTLGMSYLLPRTSLAITIYPTLIKWQDLSDTERSGELKLHVTGPIKGFTSQLMIERGFISVWGESQEGYFKYHIQPSGNHFAITNSTAITFDGGYQEETILPQLLSTERLFLGVSKKQEWEMVRRRREIKEILPLWYALSQQFTDVPYESSPSLLRDSQEFLEERDIVNIATSLSSLFSTSFRDVFVPRIFDNEHQGFTVPPFVAETPLAILPASKNLIRKLFFHQNGSILHILPVLPVEFHCGKFIGIKVTDFGEIDLEWTKKTIRRVIFRCFKSSEIQLCFQNHLRSFRLQEIETSFSKRYDCSSSLSFEAGNTYLFDNFYK